MAAKTTFPALAVALVLSLPAAAEPLDDDRAAAPAPARTKAKKRRRPVFSGRAVSPSEIRKEPLPHPSGHLKLYAVNFREPLEVDLYDADGQLDPDALDRLNHLWRCRRTGTEKPIDPQLFELLAIIGDRFPGRTIELVSGFRNQRHTTSYHFHGSASDIRIDGVSDKALHRFVASLDTGGLGLGLYPRAGFIHVDVRPQSYRWVDWSPAGSGEGAARKAKARRRAPNS